MILGIDHVVILVHDLAAACEDYTNLGFTVAPGGEHTDGATHNALIVFADGSYLELLAFRGSVPAHRWWRHTAIGEGLIDWALLPSAIADDIAQAGQHGARFEGPIAGGRQRLDGQELAWEMGIPYTADLPFLCGDVTPRELRVPEGALRTHANGALGIAGITIAVSKIKTSLPRYRALLPTQSHKQSDNLQASMKHTLAVPEAGARVAVLPAGDALVMLAQPGSSVPIEVEPTEGEESGSLGQHLATRGDGPYALTLRVESGSTTGPLDTTLTHGARLDLADEHTRS